jgi:two-component system CheB/CheR fusion protein
MKGFVEKMMVRYLKVEGIGSRFFFTLPLNEPLFKIDSLDSIEFDKSNLFLKKSCSFV